MRMILYRWIKTNSTIFFNAGSLIGTMAVTSVLGFVYWWLAAREFPLQVIGVASASISAMTLLGSIGMVGLGTLLITELPRQPDRVGSLISTALIVVGGVGGCIGLVFAVLAPYVSADFQPLRASIINILLFAVGVSLTSVTLVLDQALIGILQGGLQLWRNALFAIAKLVALFLASLWLSRQAGISVYATWAAGNAISLAALAGFVAFKKRSLCRSFMPRWALLRKLGFAALQHHLLNLTLQAPPLILPVVVTALLSARANAWFYVSWMIANFVFVVPTSFTVVLHALNSAQQATLRHKARVTLSLAFLISLAANCLLLFETKQVLSLFGSTYAEEAEWTLRILGIGALPLIIKSHYISICRIQDRITHAMLSMVPGGLLELCAAVLGALLGGLSGLSAGWVAAMSVESIFMAPTIYKTVFSSDKSVPFPERQYAGAETIWLVDTFPLPSISQGYAGTQAIWLVDTSPLPIIGQSHITAEAPWLINTSLLPIVRLPAIGQANREPNRNGQSLQDGANRRHNGSWRHLKSVQLQRFASYDDNNKTSIAGS